MGIIQKPSTQGSQTVGLEAVSATPLMDANTGLKARHFIYNERYHNMSTFATSYNSGMKVGGV